MNNQCYRLTYLFLVMFVFLLPTNIVAQECNGLLKPDIEAFQSDERLRLAYLNIVDKSSYDKDKASLGYKDLTIDNFEEERKRLYTEKRFSYDAQSSKWFYANRINPANARSFVECMNLKRPGVRINYPAAS